MITIFTIPKPFEGHIGLIQRNAIGSWARLHPNCQILLCGSEPGTREVAAEFDIESIPTVEQNEFGTPLLNSAFAAAEKIARFRLLCYVNADIVLLSDFVVAARRVAGAKRRFLMVGQRCNLDVTDEIPLDAGGWQAELRRRARQTGALYRREAMDYFVYPRGTIGPLPAFAVGRPGWDNWMIYHARKQRIPVIDATPSTLVIHQNHGHGHVKQATGTKWEGPEANANRALAGSQDLAFTLVDATHRLTVHGIEHNWGKSELKRRIRTEVILGPPFLRRSLRSLRYGPVA